MRKQGLRKIKNLAQGFLAASGKLFSYFWAPYFFTVICYCAREQTKKRSGQGLGNKFSFLHICLRLGFSALHLSINSVILQRTEIGLHLDQREGFKLSTWILFFSFQSSHSPFRSIMWNISNVYSRNISITVNVKQLFFLTRQFPPIEQSSCNAFPMSKITPNYL